MGESGHENCGDPKCLLGFLVIHVASQHIQTGPYIFYMKMDETSPQPVQNGLQGCLYFF
jgi:hypothetical protein